MNVVGMEQSKVGKREYGWILVGDSCVRHREWV